jgi:methyl-accepting chemotaxis protein
MQQAQQGALDGYRQQANNVTPPLSRAFGAAAEALTKPQVTDSTAPAWWWTA